MSSVYTRQSLSSALIQLRVIQWPGFAGLSKSEAGDSIRETIAKAQSISTNDEMSYAPVFQIGYGGVVEHVPLRTQGNGQLSKIETILGMSLYKLGIYNFVSYLTSCQREPIDISISSSCEGGTSTSIDLLPNCKFTSVARMIDVGGSLVMNSATFVYIRRLEDYNRFSAELAQ